MSQERLSRVDTVVIADGATDSAEFLADGMAMASMKTPNNSVTSYTFKSKLSATDTLQLVVAAGSAVTVDHVDDSKIRVPDEVFPCHSFVIVANAAVSGDQDYLVRGES